MGPPDVNTRPQVQERLIFDTHENNLEEDEEEQGRHHWGRKIEYILSAVGYCVGLGNIWRFPYVCMRNGGGAFLIPFFISLFATALPIYFLESAMGQFNARSCFHVWNVCPLFKGIGLSMNILTYYFVWYYSIILGWTLIYLAHSFASPLPWTLCDQSWNSPECITPEGRIMNSSAISSSINLTSPSNSNASLGIGGLFRENGTRLVMVNLTSLNQSAGALLNVTKEKSIPSTEEFWVKKVLERSESIEDLGGVPWHLALALAVANVCILLAVINGIRSTGKVVYLTATLPYILLTVMLILGITLPGSGDGMLYYIKPDFSKLLNTATWIDAFMQVFYSLGPGWGALITMSSYNKFNNNCMKDSIKLTLCCEGTSIYGGFAIFSILGHMAHVQGVSVQHFANSGAGLAFIVYPTAISYLPLPPLWGFLFFLMLFSLGLDSQFAGVETFTTTLMDLGYRWMSRWRKSTSVLIMTVVTATSLVFATRGGVYIFSLIDWYICAFSMLSQTALECLVIAWIYGTDRFSQDIQMMLGRKPYPIFIYCWKFISPAILLIVLSVTLIGFEPAKYGNYVFPPAYQAFGWVFSIIPFLCIPMYAVYELTRHPGSLWKRVKSACRPSSEWCPALTNLKDKNSLDLINEKI